MSSCTNDPFCQWLNNTCEKKCSQLTYSQCSSDPTDCQWDSKSGVCRDNCNRISLSATCNLDPMCVWNGANCLKVCNYRWFNDSSCNADSQCMWDPTKSVCVQSCGTIGDMATCQQFTVCMWDTSDTMCRTACPYLSVASCSANPACNVKNGTCAAHCSSEYNSQSPCDADSDCMWNADQNLCQRGCTGYTSAELGGVSSGAVQQDCLAQTMCRWNTSSACAKKCHYAYAVQSSCTADKTCLWDASRGFCLSACGTISAADECVQNPQCEWNAATAVCNVLCQARAFSQVPCNQIPECIWNVTAAFCQHDCSSYTTSGLCGSDLSCRWVTTTQYPTGVCQRGCTLLYNTPTTCNADQGCEWDSNMLVCRNACETLKSSDCTALPSLCLNVNGQCHTRCQVKHTDNVSCTNDADCQWDPLHLACVDNCAVLSSSTLCSGSTMCSWNSRQATCTTQCQFNNGSSCAASSVCASEDGTCVQSCINRYPTAQGCALNDNCMWNTALQACTPSCQATNNAISCGNLPQCLWNGTVCKTQCQIQYSQQGSCNSDVDCTWDASRLMCSPHCSELTTRLQCSQYPLCQYSSLGCTQSCTASYTTQSSCSAATAQNCAWNSVTGSCSTNCTGLSGAQCQANSLCELAIDTNGNIAMNGQVFNCSATCELMYSTRQTCELTSAGYCSWDPTTNLCTRACNGISSQGTCAAASTCNWNYVSQSCVVQCNFVADCTTRPDCVTDPDTGICKVACSGRASLTDCNSDSDCTWSAKSVTCETRCESILNSTQCVNSGTCVWNGPTSSCMR
ncbi:Hypothetical protein, putative, partial [Bodo saltans]